MMVPTVAITPLARQAFTVTYDDGFYHPASSALAIEQAASIYSSFDVNSIITENIPTATTPLSTASPTTSTSSSASSQSSSVVAAPTSLPTTVTSSTTSTSPTPQPSSDHSDENSKKGLHITINQLIPLFIILGLVVLLLAAGKIWGAYANKKARIARRRRKQNRQLLRDHLRAERERAIQIRSSNTHADVQEEEKVDLEKQYNVEVNDFDAANSSYDDDAQLRGQRSVYHDDVQTTPWLEVQWRSVFRGKTHKRLQQEEKEAKSKGTWGRMKDSIGWGYDGTSPNVSQRRELLGMQSGEDDATHVLLYGDNLPHAPAGILLPPRLDVVSKSDVKSPIKSKRKPIPSSPPEIQAPPNTLRGIPASSSANRAINVVKDLFTSAHLNTHHGLDIEEIKDTSGIPGDASEKSSLLFGHHHADGRKCSLDEPQYLPPPSVRQKVDREVKINAEVKSEPEQVKSALTRVPTQLQFRDTPEQADHVDQRMAMPLEAFLDESRDEDVIDKDIADTIFSMCRVDKADTFDMRTGIDDNQEREVIFFQSPRDTQRNDDKASDKQTDLHQAKVMTGTQSSVDSERSKKARDVIRANSGKSTKSYTQAVKFDDEERHTSQEFKASRLKEERGLSRSKTMSKIMRKPVVFSSDESIDRDKLARAYTVGSPIASPSTSKKSSWREINGKWQRTAIEEGEVTPFSSTMSPTRPPAAWRHSTTTTLASPDRFSKVSSTVRSGVNISPKRSLAMRQSDSIKSPSVYSTLSNDTYQGISAMPLSTASFPLNSAILHPDGPSQYHMRYLTDARKIDEEEDEEMLSYPESMDVECHAALDRMQNLISRGHAS